MVLVATVIAVADIAFVFFVVPESLPDKMRLTSWGFPISWEQADPFAVSLFIAVTALTCSALTDRSIFVFLVCSVSASGGERHHGAADLRHRVPVLPA